MEKQLLHKYFAGETTPQEENEIIDWAENSSENYQTYLFERKLWNTTLVNCDSIPVNVNKRQKKSYLFLWKAAAIAASVALIISISQLISFLHISDDKMQTIWVPAGQRAQLTLDDGTTVWLNSKTKLSYPVSFKAKERFVELDGEAYFEVTKNKNKPFIVQTNKYNVEVLGTSFNVLSYNCNDNFETALLNGSLRVSSNQNSNSHVVLEPNEIVRAVNGEMQINKIDKTDYFRWREGLICFDDERFEDLINKLALYFDIKITINSPKLLDYPFTGKFRISDGIDYALKVIQAEIRFSYTRNNELNEINIK